MKLKWKLTLSAKLEILKYAAAVILVMVIGALIIFSQGNSPVEAFRAMIIGSGESRRHRYHHPLGDAQHHNGHSRRGGF